MKNKSNFFETYNGRMLAVGVIVVLVGVFVMQQMNVSLNPSAPETVTATDSTTKGAVKEVKIKDRMYQVEVMTTSPQIQRGLSGRSEIGSDGMLFVFQQKAMYTFWMKEMLIDLDFLWIADGKVVQIMENIPAPPTPDTPDEELLHYQPNVPVNLVLELPAGFVATYDIQVGDEVRILE